MCVSLYKIALNCGTLEPVLTCNAGDEERPRCKRCDAKDLPCERPTKKTIFRHGARAKFAKDQKWVNTSAKQCEFPYIELHRVISLTHPVRVHTGDSIADSPIAFSPESSTQSPEITAVPTPPQDDIHRPSIPSISYLDNSASAMNNTLPPIEDPDYRRFPLQDVQEACLLRYFVEEISRWVSFLLSSTMPPLLTLKV